MQFSLKGNISHFQDIPLLPKLNETCQYRRCKKFWSNLYGILLQGVNRLANLRGQNFNVFLSKHAQNVTPNAMQHHLAL